MTRQATPDLRVGDILLHGNRERQIAFFRDLENGCRYVNFEDGGFWFALPTDKALLVNR